MNKELKLKNESLTVLPNKQYFKFLCQKSFRKKKKKKIRKTIYKIF